MRIAIITIGGIETKKNIGEKNLFKENIMIMANLFIHVNIRLINI